MYLKYKLQTLKMQEHENMTKQIYVYQTILEQLAATRAHVLDDKIASSLMKSVPNSYRTFISSLRRQAYLRLQSLITNLIQEENLNKNINTIEKITSALYARKKN